MRNKKKVLLAFALVLAAFSQAGCPEGTTIAEINRDPGRFRDKEVVIEGNVVNSFGALGEGGYEVDDGTGKIWVLVTHSGGVPGRDARVRVRGRVTPGLTFAGRSFGTVIREIEHRTERTR